MSPKFLLAIPVLVGCALCALAAVPDRTAITVENAFTFYRSFERLTKVPRRVQPSVAEMCMTPSPEAIARVKAATGPHGEALVHFYANTEGAALRAKATDPFPVGAVIVKEKLDTDGRAHAIGGMRKRPAGFDPANGDWEYFYATRSGSFTLGKLANCAACHAQTKATDYVYSLSYRLQKQ